MGTQMKMIFQKYNTPAHTAEITEQWFEDNHVCVIQRHAQCPKLDIFLHLGGRLRKSHNQCKTNKY